MAQICQTCGKTISVANNRSHSNRATKRRMYPNLQGSNKLPLRCTRCMRTETHKRQVA